jgi:hypothetical protein
MQSMREVTMRRFCGPSQGKPALSQPFLWREKIGKGGEGGFLLTEREFNFRIITLEPNTYDGLLFVTAYVKGMDHSIANAGRTGVF